MPIVGDQATPPMVVVPPLLTVAPLTGTSIRDWVLTGPSLLQPRGIQNPSTPIQSVIEIRSIHLVAETYP